MLENNDNDSKLQTKFGVYITSNNFKMIQFQIQSHQRPIPTSQLWKLTLSPEKVGGWIFSR